VRKEETVDHSMLPEDSGQTNDVPGDLFKSSRFDPIDSRHLSSLPLLRGRVVKLLNNSANSLHPSQNLLVTLVC
jgi:oxalate---CoA ligase